MANLIIIGNGFDLAHGLKTDYSSFLKSLIIKCLYDAGGIDGIIDYNMMPMNLRKQEFNDNIKVYKQAVTSNFLREILVNDSEPNWCDLENAYYKYIVENILANENYNTFINDFHKEFAMLIHELELYLLEQEKNEIKLIESYKHLFNDRLKDNCLIVNFNYTNTLKLYNPNYKNVIHIHGELNNPDNPIIFGYAANDDDCQMLFKKNNNEFIRHVKKYNYSLTDNYQRILNFFNDYRDDEIDISIFGHSCSMSDNLILNQIFNHPNTTKGKIRFFYFEDKENPKEPFFQNQINLARVLNGNLDPSKLVSFSKSHRMPQKEDDAEQIKRFKEYIDNNLQNLDMSIKLKKFNVEKI